MSHIRKQLRDAVVSAVTGLTTTGSRVYTAKVYPVSQAEMPCLVVNAIEDVGQPEGLSLPGILGRQVTIEVLGMARATSALADELDAIAEEVETALGVGVTVSGTTIALDYVGANLQFSGEADQPIGTVATRFTALVYTLSNAPGTLVQV